MNPELLQAIANADGLDAKDAETMGNWLRENENLLYKGLNQADDQLKWLKGVASLDDVEKIKFIRGMNANKMAKFMSWAKGLQSKLGRAAGTGKAAMAKVPWNKVFKAAVALGVAIELYNAASLYQEYGWEGANQSLSLAVINLIPSNILGQVMLDYATSVGYDTVARVQGCENLMAGIFEVKGRQHVGQGVQISDLAKLCVDEDCVASAVRKQAEKASHKQLDQESVAGLKGAKAIQARLVSQCLLVVLKAWKRERYALLNKVLSDKTRIDKLLSRTAIVLETRSARSGGEVEITARPRFQFSPSKLLALLRAMEDDLKALGGPERLGRLDIAEKCQWSVERFSYAQGRWLVRERLPLKVQRLNPRDPRKKIFAGLEEVKVKLPAGPNYRLVLDWSLALAPGLAEQMDWRAPEVQEFRAMLRANYGFKAQAPVETARWRFALTGPARLAAGAPGKLLARVEGSPPWAGEAGVASKIIWRKGRSLRPVASGPTLAVTGPDPGPVTYSAALMIPVGGKPSELAEAVHEINGLQAAWLRLTARDSVSGAELGQARWRVSGPGGFTARHSGAVLSLPTAVPGSYRISVSASEHEPKSGGLSLAPGKRYNKVAALKPLTKEQAKPLAKPEPPAPKQPQPPAPAPAAQAPPPAPPAQPCDWQQLPSRQASSTRGTVPGKRVPPTKTYNVAIPGPGVVRIATTITGKHGMANHRYGANRFLSGVHWSCPDGSCKSGKMHAGKFYPGVVDVGKNTASIRMSKAGSLQIKVWGESCYRAKKDHKGRPVCYQCCSGYGEYGTITLPVTIGVKMKFKPECPKGRRR
ncbi:MAG: hypothetical protein K9K33_13565 [Desulfarculaceae bacterium]|nr:hypothetical protein [Desulfarculaceae bacterium]